MSKFSIHVEIITIIMSRFFSKQTQWTKKNNIRKFTMVVISKYYQCFCQMWYGKKKCNVLQKLSMGKVQSCNNKLFLVDLPLLHLVMELHLLFLWSKKRLELGHGNHTYNVTLMMMKTLFHKNLGNYFFFFTPCNPRTSQVNPNANSFSSVIN